MELSDMLQAPTASSPGKWHPLNTKLCGPHKRSGHFEKDKYLLPLPRIEPRFLGCAAIRLLAILTTHTCSKSNCSTLQRKITFGIHNFREFLPQLTLLQRGKKRVTAIAVSSVSVDGQLCFYLTCTLRSFKDSIYTQHHCVYGICRLVSKYLPTENVGANRTN
jgi:hypothetical protein